MRLVGGNEDLVGIVLAEAGEVDEEAVFVWHRDFDLVDFGYVRERTYSHRVESLLHGLAVVVGKGAEHGLSNFYANGFEVEGSGDVLPLGTDGGSEEAVFGLGQSGERVLDVAFEAGVRGLEQDEIVEARENMETSALLVLYVGRLKFVAAAHEGAGMRVAVDGEMLPHGAFDAD